MYNKIKLKILRKILLKAKTNHNNKTALKQIRNIKVKKFKIVQILITNNKITRIRLK